MSINTATQSRVIEHALQKSQRGSIDEIPPSERPALIGQVSTDLQGEGISTRDVREALLDAWSQSNADKGASGLQVTGGKDAGFQANAGAIGTFKEGGGISPIGAAIMMQTRASDGPSGFRRSPLVDQDVEQFKLLVAQAGPNNFEGQSQHVARVANAKVSLERFGDETRAPQQLVIKEPPPVDENGKRILDLTLVTHVSAHLQEHVVKGFIEKQEYAVRVTMPDGTRRDLDPIVGESSPVALKDLSLELFEGKTTIEVSPKGSGGSGANPARRITEIYFGETPPEVETPALRLDRNGRLRSASRFSFPISRGPAPDGTIGSVNVDQLPKSPKVEAGELPAGLKAAQADHKQAFGGNHLGKSYASFLAAGSAGAVAKSESLQQETGGPALLTAENASLNLLRFGYHTGKPMEAWIQDPPADGKLMVRLALREDEVETKVKPRPGQEHLHGDFQIEVQYPDGGSERFRIDKHDAADKVTVTDLIEVDLGRARGGHVAITGFPDGGDAGQYPEGRVTILHVDD